MFGLIGENLGHSYSKIIHEYFCDYNYNLIQLKHDELKLFFKNKDFEAINITIPFKQDVIRYLDVIDDSVTKMNACNCIVNKDNILYGYNTDYYGFMKLLELNSIDLSFKKIMILGNGGACKAIECFEGVYVCVCVCV